MGRNRENRGQFLFWVTAGLLGVALQSFLPAANTLTREEAAAGWIQLFDGETLFGWNSIGEGEWEVVDGSLVCQSGPGSRLVTSNQFADFEMVAHIRIQAGTSAGLVVRGSLGGHPADHGSSVVTLTEPEGAQPPWREVRLRAQGKRVIATVDGRTRVDLEACRSYGYIAIQYHHYRGVPGRVELSEVRLRPLGLEAIFSGKDLSGWNTLPNLPSEFSVHEGALNIRKGPGQIETEALYRDFILQLDIISHGPHLNSGVFVRGRPGVPFRGYESQIRNQWNGEDRTDPVDFGTGGVYGMQPARAVVSNDGEWFHKTILCVENQLTVWVDGYMVADFTETRPIHAEANGKLGYVPGPGTIHLQGHDPTTDLSFKNIRLQDFSDSF